MCSWSAAVVWLMDSQGSDKDVYNHNDKNQARGQVLH